MTAITYNEIKYEDNSDLYSTVNYKADIHESTKIEPYCIIEQDVKIGKNCIIGPYNFIRNGTTIGDNCMIGGFNCFEGNKVNIGNRVRIGTHCNFGWKTTIEDFAFLAGHITGANDKKMTWCREIKGNDIRGYVIKKGARIGLGAIMMPGIIVGEESIVGTASLVTKDVQDGEIVYGVPARHMGWVPEGERISVITS